MPRLGGILLGCMVSLLRFVLPASAVDILHVYPDQPLAFPVAFQADPSTEYHVKVRFSQASSSCEPACDGQTSTGQGWGSQSVAWTELPTILTDKNGFGMALAIGRYQTEPSQGLPKFAQVAVRKTGSTSTRVIGSYSLQWDSGIYPIQLEAYTDEGQSITNAYVKLRDQSGEQILPLGVEGPTLSARVAHRSIEVELFDGAGRLIHGLTRYELRGEGVYAIKLNASAMLPYHPTMHTVDIARPYEAVDLQLLTDRAYNGAVVWYRDGQKVMETGSRYAPIFETSGRHVVTALLPATGERVESTIIVESYPNVILASLLPNPDGSDTRKETITFKNNNPFRVQLQKWTLKNRATQRNLKIEGTIAPHSEYAIHASSFLTNGGGTFDLYNESNQLVDTATYPAVEDNSVVTRNGILWQVNASEGDEGTRLTHERVAGVVTKPSGNTVDIETEAGPVHIVVHRSFDGQKPRLAKGDKVEVTGIWLRSGRGPYLSVRKGDIFILIESSQVNVVRGSKSKKKPTTSGLVPRAKAASPLEVPQVQAAAQPERTITLDYPSSSPYNPHLRWLFIALLAVGAWLTLDDRRHTSK